MLGRGRPEHARSPLIAASDRRGRRGGSRLGGAGSPGPRLAEQGGEHFSEARDSDGRPHEAGRGDPGRWRHARSVCARWSH